MRDFSTLSPDVYSIYINQPLELIDQLLMLIRIKPDIFSFLEKRSHVAWLKNTLKTDEHLIQKFLAWRGSSDSAPDFKFSYYMYYTLFEPSETYERGMNLDRFVFNNQTFNDHTVHQGFWTSIKLKSGCLKFRQPFQRICNSLI